MKFLVGCKFVLSEQKDFSGMDAKTWKNLEAVKFISYSSFGIKRIVKTYYSWKILIHLMLTVRKEVWGNVCWFGIDGFIGHACFVRITNQSFHTDGKILA